MNDNEKEMEKVPELFERIGHNLITLLNEHGMAIYKELKDSTAKAMQDGGDMGKVAVVFKVQLDSGGFVSRHRESIEYSSTHKVRQELDPEIFNPVTPELFDRDGNPNPEIEEASPVKFDFLDEDEKPGKFEDDIKKSESVLKASKKFLDTCKSMPGVSSVSIGASDKEIFCKSTMPKKG